MYEIGIGNSSKSRALKSLSKWEKQEQRVHIGVTIENKIIDGVKKTVFTCDGMFNCGPGGKRELPKEFTNIGEFTKYVEERIKSIDSQL